MRDLRALVLMGFLLAAGIQAPLISIAAEERPRWEGVDKAVVERYAEAHDRKARGSWLGEEGDLLLFCFALGGAVGGFILGYNWRILFREGRGNGSGKGPAATG